MRIDYFAWQCFGGENESLSLHSFNSIPILAGCAAIFCSSSGCQHVADSEEDPWLWDLEHEHSLAGGSTTRLHHQRPCFQSFSFTAPMPALCRNHMRYICMTCGHHTGTYDMWERPLQLHPSHSASE